MDALEDFPENADVLKTRAGTAHLIKTDIFKGLLYYVYENDKMRGNIIAVDKERATEIKKLNQKGNFPDELVVHQAVVMSKTDEANIEHEYEDVTGLIELRNEPKKKRKKKPFKNDRNKNPRSQSQDNKTSENPINKKEQSGEKDSPKPPKSGNQQNKHHSHKPKPDSNQTNQDNSDKKNSENNDTNNAGSENKNKRRFYNKNRKPKDGQ